MLWCQHRQVLGRQDTVLVADSTGAHVSKEPRMAKMDPSAADMALAVRNGYVWLRMGSSKFSTRSSFSSAPLKCQSL